MVYVHPERYRPTQTRRMAKVVGRINGRLARKGRPYLLVGPGRWGTSDPSLGIPVDWSEVSGARVLVELELSGLGLEPSQGSHFYHNLLALKVGFFSLNLRKEEHTFDLDWLESQATVSEEDGVRHVEVDEPIIVRIDGKSGFGAGVRGTRSRAILDA